jgi:hypothetical protein
METDWQANAIGVAAIGLVYVIVYLIPRLLVRFEIISDSEPVVSQRMPISRDWLLTICTLLAALVIVAIKDPADVVVLYVIGVFLVAAPWWIWRSFKAVLYYKQNKGSIGTTQLLALIVTNIFSYMLVLSALKEIHLIQ